MADQDNTHVTLLRPLGHAGRQAERRQKAAERKRRSRARRKQSTPLVTPDQSVTRDPPVVTPRDTPAVIKEAPFERDSHVAADVTAAVIGVAPPKRDGVTISTLAAALALAVVSGGFSIYGMTSIFVGATLPVIAMGVALEVGKLAAVASSLPRLHWGPLRASLAVLMGLNAVGAYGFLAKAHIGHALAGDLAVSGRAADVEARISVQAGLVADVDRRLAQIDGAVEKATSKGRAASAMALADQQRKARGELVAQRTNEAKTLASLQVEKAGIEGQRRIAEADLGPVRYLATLLGADNETVFRWFILVVALLLDPAAVLLLLAAVSGRKSG